MNEGTIFGRYKVLGPLGEGGMGRVYLAEDPSLKRRVAIKVLPPEFSADAERRSRLLSEARAASALNHPNIVTVYDLGDDGGELFVAMEVVEGDGLRAWAGARAHSAAEVIALARQATRALAVAHAAGLVHRDLKPENLMVRRDGLLKILDFGLARSAAAADESATMARTMPGTILGTAPYMSPEQVLGRAAGPASDVFSLGTLTYELLTGRHPFVAATAVDTMHRILHETPPPPSALVPGLPAALDFVLAKALAKDPARRYEDAGAFDLDLETCEAGLAPAPAAPTGAAGAAGGAGSAGARPARAIAVLPFKNIGGNADLNYLGIGLADAVITRLSNSPDLIVRPTSAIAVYENRPVDSRVVARELEVSAVLDASFQRAGERFRATARLVEMPGGQALWAGKVDLDFADIFAVQDEVAHGIATALTARLTTDAVAAAGVVGDAGPVARAFTPKVEAFELCMRAQEALRAGTRSGLDRAIELGRRAVEIEPGYADAWAQLAFTYHAVSDGGFEPDTTWYDRAEIAAQRALEIDPDHAMALFAVAALHVVRGRKREAFEQLVHCRRLAPNLPMVLHYIGYTLRLSDLYDDAIRAYLEGIELDPSAPVTYWGILRVYMESGRIDEAVAWWERVSARFVRHPRTLEYQLILLFWQGRFEEVLADAARLGSELEERFAGVFYPAMALARLGRIEEARAAVPKIARLAWADMDYAAYGAALYAHLGDPDGAFRLLARATKLGNDMLALYENPGLFGPLFGDPRWAPFVAGVRERVASYRQQMRWPLAPAPVAAAARRAAGPVNPRSPLFPETEAKLAAWRADPDVLGIVLVGSKSRGHDDARSDDDLEVLLTDEAAARIPPAQCLDVLVTGEGPGRRVIYDAQLTSLSALVAKRHSVFDLDHWPYERGEVLFARDPRVREAVAAAGAMNAEFRRLRLKHATIDAWIAPYRAVKTFERGFLAAGRLLVARGARALSRIAFALEDRWVPLDHWLEPELASLADASGVVPMLLAGLREGNPKPLDDALSRLEDRLAAEGVARGDGRRALFLELIHPANAAERAVHGLV